MFKIVVFVPKNYSEKVKKEMFKAGGGKFKNYDCCSFETEGIGQFRPLKNSKPFVGSLDKVKKVKEVRLEMICEKKYLKKVISSMKKSHPYEEVAYEVSSLFAI